MMQIADALAYQKGLREAGYRLVWNYTDPIPISASCIPTFTFSVVKTCRTSCRD